MSYFYHGTEEDLAQGHRDYFKFTLTGAQRHRGRGKEKKREERREKSEKSRRESLLACC